jgi:hypothetical protein
MNWTETEHEIAAALQEETNAYTEQCLDPDDLILLIEQGGAAPDAANRLGHLAGCAYCRHAYAEMRQTLRLADKARAWQETAGARPEAVSTADPVTGGRKTSGRALTFLRDSLSRPRFAYGATALVAACMLIYVATTRSRMNELTRRLDLLTGSEKQAQLRVQAEQAQAALTEQNRLSLLARSRQQERRLLTLQRENGLMQQERRRQIVFLAAQNARRQGDAVNQTAVHRQPPTIAMPVEIAALMLTPQRGVARGGDEEFRLEEPFDRAVAANRPQFTWTRFPDAHKYRIEIFVPGAKRGMPDITLRRAETSELSWQPEKPLPPDRILQWKVTAVLADGQDGPTAPKPVIQSEARFYILSSGLAEKWRRLVTQTRVSSAIR